MSGLDASYAPRSRRRVASVRILAPLVVLAAALGACNGGDDEDAVPPGPDPDEVETSRVEIKDLAFNPPAITVAAGNVVEWTNKDLLGDAPPPGSDEPPIPPPGTEHTVTSDEAGTFDSGPLGGEATFSYTFLEPGTYAYHCSIHADMTGTVQVT